MDNELNLFNFSVNTIWWAPFADMFYEIFLTLQLQNVEEKNLVKTFEYYRSYSRAHLLLAEVYMGLGDRDNANKQAELAIKIGLPKHLSDKAYNIIKIDDNS